jgi:hypothetical protein
MSIEIDYRHMRRAESEIIRAQMVILRALLQILPRIADTDVADEILGTMENLYQFHYDGKYDDDDDNDNIMYADSK